MHSGILAGSGWTPTALGDDLTQWCRSGVGYTTTAGTSGGKPLFRQDGPPQYLSTPDAATLAADADFSWCGWVMPTAIAGNQALGSKRDAGQYEWVVALVGSGQVWLFCYDHTAATAVLAQCTTALTAGTRYFVCARRNATAGTFRISVNNANEAVTTAALTMTRGTGPYRLGRVEAGTDYPFGGVLEGVGFWQRSITDAEVTALYNAGTPLAYAGLSAGLKVSLSSWLDLSAPESPYVDAADPVIPWQAHGNVGLDQCTQWADQSGGGHHLRADAVNRTGVGTMPNGRPAVWFDGAETWMEHDPVGSLLSGMNVPFTWFGACKHRAFVGTLGQCFFMAANVTTGTANPTHDLFYRGESGDYWSGRRGEVGGVIYISGGVPDTDPHAFIFVFDGTTSKLYVDGVVVISAAQGLVETMTVNGWTIGRHRRVGSADLTFDGPMAEVGLVLRAIDASDVTALNDYLSRLLI